MRPDDVARRLLEDPDELAADDLALLLGVRHPGQRRQEPLPGVDDDEVDPGRRHEVLLDLLGLARRAAARGRRTRRSAGRRRPSAPARPPPRSRRRRTAPQMTRASPTWSRTEATSVVDDVGGGPLPRRARRRAAGSSRAPAGRTSSAAPPGATARRRAGGRRPRTPATGAPDVVAVTAHPGGRLGHRVAVAHPHRLVGGLAVEQGRRHVEDRRRGCAELGQARSSPRCRRAPAPSPGSRSTCRTPAPRPRAARRRARARPPRTPTTDRRRGSPRRGPCASIVRDRHRVRHDLAEAARPRGPAAR